MKSLIFPLLDAVPLKLNQRNGIGHSPFCHRVFTGQVNLAQPSEAPPLTFRYPRSNRLKVAIMRQKNAVVVLGDFGNHRIRRIRRQDVT